MRWNANLLQSPACWFEFYILPIEFSIIELFIRFYYFVLLFSEKVVILSTEVVAVNETPVIRIQRASIRNFRNVESGEIRFPCNYSEDIFAPKADVLGIYGQNGSGKTTFIDALEILKTLLSGQKVGAELSDCISYGQEKAELQFEFSILKLNEGNVVYKRRLIYSTVLSKDAIDETVKCATTRTDSAKTAWMKPIFECTHQSEDAVFSPQVRLESLFGSKQNAKINELRVIKLLCQKEHRSFLFSPEFLKMLHDVAQEHDEKVEPLFELSNFANTSFFVILNRNNGLISLDAAIPVNFRTETAGGTFALPIDQPVTIPNRFLEIIQQVIATISTVLCEIVPGAQLSLVELRDEQNRRKERPANTVNGNQKSFGHLKGAKTIAR